jgi:DNA-binding protein H-NS
MPRAYVCSKMLSLLLNYPAETMSNRQKIHDPATLRNLEAIEAQIRSLEEKKREIELERHKAIRTVVREMERHHLTFDDIRRNRSANKALAKSRRKTNKAATANRRKVPIKYRDKKGNTWTGRGRTPRWLVAAENAGQKRADFAV